MNQRYLKGVAAVLIGSAVNHFGDRLLGVRLELFYGIPTFSLSWVIDMFLVPFMVGLVVASIFGYGARWLSYVPPLIVRTASYAEIYFTGAPDGTSLIPLGWWGFFVILTMEASWMGGIIGEVMIKKVYGRTPPVIDVIAVPPSDKPAIHD